MAPPLTPAVQAAGALLWRERDGRLEVALVHRPRYRDWSWPKGKLDAGESLPACAVREVEEETGTPVVLGVPLPGNRYRTGDGRAKQVHYWAARPATDDDAGVLAARGPVQRATADEIDEVVWVGAAAAGDVLTRREDRPPLERLIALWSAGRLDTRVLAVVRHGQAVRRADWPGDDPTRPLTPEGDRQALALVGVLAAFGVRSVVTSPWERCVRTALPYARAAGVEPERVAALSQDAYRADPRPAADVVRRRLAEPDDAAVVTHRPVLRGVLPVVEATTRRWTAGRVPDTNPFLQTGEVLVAHVRARSARTRTVALERHRPT